MTDYQRDDTGCITAFNVFCRHSFKKSGKRKPGQVLSGLSDTVASTTDYLVAGVFSLVEAIATVHWPVTAGLEGYFSVLATLGTHGRVHLSRSPGAIAASEPTATTARSP